MAYPDASDFSSQDGDVWILLAGKPAQNVARQAPAVAPGYSTYQIDDPSFRLIAEGRGGDLLFAVQRATDPTETASYPSSLSPRWKSWNQHVLDQLQAYWQRLKMVAPLKTPPSIPATLRADGRNGSISLDTLRFAIAAAWFGENLSDFDWSQVEWGDQNNMPMPNIGVVVVGSGFVPRPLRIHALSIVNAPTNTGVNAITGGAVTNAPPTGPTATPTRAGVSGVTFTPGGSGVTFVPDSRAVTPTPAQTPTQTAQATAQTSGRNWPLIIGVGVAAVAVTTAAVYLWQKE